MSRRWGVLGLLVALCGLAGPASAAASVDLPALPMVTVTRVSDGDTVWVKQDGGRPYKLRLLGLDAPESCQPGGTEATEALRARVLHRRVRLAARARDDYQRTLAHLYLDDGTDVSAWMVAQGQAWSYRSARSPGPYAAEEREARARRLGLFADPAAIEPSVFRRTHGPCDLPGAGRRP